jgi:hypothetical protein
MLSWVFAFAWMCHILPTFQSYMPMLGLCIGVDVGYVADVSEMHSDLSYLLSRACLAGICASIYKAEVGRMTHIREH